MCARHHADSGRSLIVPGLVTEVDPLIFAHLLLSYGRFFLAGTLFPRREFNISLGPRQVLAWHRRSFPGNDGRYPIPDSIPDPDLHII